jgi:hypothetical protein
MSNSAGKLAFRDGTDRSVMVGSGGPLFQLVGEELHDASKHLGPLGYKLHHSLFGAYSPLLGKLRGTAWWIDVSNATKHCWQCTTGSENHGALSVCKAE